VRPQVRGQRSPPENREDILALLYYPDCETLAPANEFVNGVVA
jgi:hypothetical protein